MLEWKDLENILKYHNDRINLIEANKTDYNYYEWWKIVLHIIPKSSLSRKLDWFVDLQKITTFDVQPFLTDWWNKLKSNFDGCFASCDLEGKNISSTQVFRNWIIEGIDTNMLWAGDEKILPSLSYEKNIIKSLSWYVSLLEKLEITEPVYMFLSFIWGKGVELWVSQWRFLNNWNKLLRNRLIFPYLYIDDYSVNFYDKLKPIFYMVWNSFGFKRSFNYDDSWEWRG